MFRRMGLYAAAVALVLAAVHFLWSTQLICLSWRALFSVALYTACLVIARYSPGCCLYRIWVLSAPSKRLPVEVAKAREFVTYVCRRVLFAGLIFTLADIAIVLNSSKDFVRAAGPLSMALSASLYSLILYLMLSRAARAAMESPQALGA